MRAWGGVMIDVDKGLKNLRQQYISLYELFEYLMKNPDNKDVSKNANWLNARLNKIEPFPPLHQLDDGYIFDHFFPNVGYDEDLYFVSNLLTDIYNNNKLPDRDVGATSIGEIFLSEKNTIYNLGFKKEDIKDFLK